MSEKRFVLYEHKGNYYILENPREYLDFIEMLGDALTDEEIVNLLNEQQSIIKYLTIEKHQADKRFQTILAELKKENEQLKGLIKKTLEITPIEHNLAVELKNSVREFYD